MLQAAIIVLREGFEGFLIVAIILSYLRKAAEKSGFRQRDIPSLIADARSRARA